MSQHVERYIDVSDSDADYITISIKMPRSYYECLVVDHYDIHQYFSSNENDYNDIKSDAAYAARIILAFYNYLHNEEN